ncbi:hypothetical protein ACFSWE_16050 [Leucobacter albus]|uniref:Transcriptional regulator, AbiEi antitoxin, Type IV TA system n=1 Tax=Leucobacter albus TaxID=272210 RepID=A0ABW3TNC6_9MICO
MTATADLNAVSKLLVSTDELRHSGMTDSCIAAAIASGAFVRLRRGWHVPSAFWGDARPEVRHLAAVLAAHRGAVHPPVFSHLSAAALHSMPAWSNWLRVHDAAARAPDPLAVHTTLSRLAGASSNRRTIRHRATLPLEDTESQFELLTTTPDRTLADLARTQPFAVALASADARLRSLTRIERQVDTAALTEWRERMAQRAHALGGVAGSRAIRALAELANPLADSPLESLSRMRFLQLGIEVRLQVRVPGPGSRSFYLDFELPGLGFWGEADGRYKYSDERAGSARSAADVLYAEKRRADWIAGTTGLRLIRWGAREASSLTRFASHLRAHGVPIPASQPARWSKETMQLLRRLG